MLSSIICFFVGLFIVIYSPKFELGTLKKPGTGFMPFLAGLVICMFATATFIQALLDKSSVGEKIWADLKFRKLLITILMLIAYAFLIKPVGFLIGTFFLILLLSRYIGYQTWLRSVLLAFSSSILSYLLFETWLRAQLPRGIVGF